MTDQDVTITWLGHSTLVVETPEGKRLIIDPWLDENPGVPEDFDGIHSLDGLLLSHGHFDHAGDAVRLVDEFDPQVIGIFEVATWLENNGAENVVPMNEGGTFQSEELQIDLTAVHAQHSSCVMYEDNTLGPGGDPLGWVIDFSSGKTLYYTGDTNVFSDMALVSDLYDPDMVILPIGDHFTMGPREAAKAIELIDVDHVVPVHYGTFPVLTGTPDALKAELDASRADAVEVVDPGGSVSL
jgi:L-ascorbate metabolism protein UlaG (beta-lactamase superfamily)